ncbi:MAG: hypothetical protein WC246_02750 [Candidatus Paceibacterota bacterium]|jgi:transcription elongation GreA/GreB family factor
MVNKNYLIDAVVVALEKERADNEESLKQTRQTAMDAPSAMQSHSDTTRSQMEHLAENFERFIAEKNFAIENLKAFKKEISASGDEIKVGSLVGVTEGTNMRHFYFILPFGGGVAVVDKEGRSVVVLSASAPLARALLGKKSGTETTTSTRGNIRVLHITSVE